MGNFVYGLSTFERRRGDFPQLPVVNMLGENIPVEPGVTLQSRPGLEDSDIDMGVGPVRELFQIDGVLNNGLFGVSGNKLFNGNTEIGTVDGSGNVSICGYEDHVFVNAGEKIYKYDGTTFSEIIFPDDADVSKIAVGASRLIALRKDSGTFYWSEPLGITVPSLNFATAENVPDKALDILFIADRLIIFGSETVETWPVASDQDLPFQPLPGATFPVGIKATGCATMFGRTFAWITNYNEVCVGAPENIISDPELQVRLNQATNPRLWVFFVDDNEYLAVTLDNETWVYGLRTQLWATLKSFGETNWVCRCYQNGYFGTSLGGTLAQWSDDYSDFDGPIERSFNGWVPLTQEPLWLANTVLRTNPGTTPDLEGDLENPVVELRTSQDGGRTWQPWQSQNLGRQGDYRARTIWSSLGQFGYPGVLVQVRCTDPVPFRVSGLSYNEPFGGI